MANLAVIGYGFVGKGTEYLLNICGNMNIALHDPAQGLVIKNWSGTQYAFICVPTPESEDNLDLDISMVQECYQMCLDNNVIPVIRSTLGPDQVSHFPEAIMMPEFLREANWIEDVEQIDTLIFGGDATELARLFSAKNYMIVDAQTAMLYKMARNALLATKVVIANQLKGACTKLDASYDDLVQLLMHNNTLGQTHWSVPGPDGLPGYGGKCFPKDISHMSTLCEPHNIFSHAIKINNKLRKGE